MARWTRVIGAVILAAILSGCATYRPATLPPGAATPQADDPVERVRVGAIVRVTLKTGEVIVGEVHHLDDVSLSFAKPTNFGLQVRTVILEDIATLEVRKDTTITNIFFSTMTALFLGCVALVALLAVALTPMDMS